MFNQPTDEAIVSEILDKSMPECLAYLETVVPESGYLVGDSLSVADLAVTTCFIQARYGDYDVDGSAAPRLRRYLDQAYAAPLVVARMEAEQAALPPGLG
jgi:glutathione S-transferase